MQWKNMKFPCWMKLRHVHISDASNTVNELFPYLHVKVKRRMKRGIIYNTIFNY